MVEATKKQIQRKHTYRQKSISIVTSYPDQVMCTVFLEILVISTILCYLCSIYFKEHYLDKIHSCRCWAYTAICILQVKIVNSKCLCKLLMIIIVSIAFLKTIHITFVLLLLLFFIANAFLGYLY